jgi:hypothetical protein
MALTKVKGSGLATGAATASLVGIDDNATSTAITIDASENVTLANSAILKVKDAFGDTAMQFNVLSSGSNSGRISVDPDNTGASSQLSVYVDASEKLTVLSTGDVTVGTGNLVIGTSGKGIDFSADGNAAGMTSEVLDDYETGTWTPTIATGTASMTEATYTKVGNIVYATANVNNITDITSTNVVVLGGLPFAPQTTRCVGSAMMSYTGGVQNQLWLSGGTSMHIYGTHTGDFVQLKHADFNNTSADIYFSITYKVA